MLSRCDICRKRIDLYFYGCDDKLVHLVASLIIRLNKLKASWYFLKDSLSKLKQKSTL